MSAESTSLPSGGAAAVTRRRVPRGLTLLASAAVLVGCAQPPRIPAPLRLPSVAASNEDGVQQRETGTRLEELPAAPQVKAKPAPSQAVSPKSATSASASEEPAILNLEQVPLGTFAQIIFAEVLKKNVNIDPQVLARKDLVTFRSGGKQERDQIEAAAKLLLKSYGIAALDLGGLVRVLPDSANLGNLPEIRRGAALPETPLPLRPIFYLVDLKAVRQTEITAFLRTLFGERVKVQEDAIRNALLISGTPDNVEAALEAIRVLDQPTLIGGRSLSISPVNWSAEDFAKRLVEVLTAQGYAVQPITATAQQPGGVRYPIIVLPVAGINAVYVFARGDDVIKHIEQWAQTLDKPNERGIGKNFFTYAVKHKDASSLADTLDQLLSGSRGAGAGAQARPAGTAQAGTAAAQVRASGVVVDKATNMLIFQSSQEEYSQINALLQRLDQPSKAALIEVTVAELSIDDSSQLGVEWAFADTLSRGRTARGGTVGGLGLGTGGFTYKILDSASQVKVALNALASDNRANILSSPRVQARNGETATIQVGQEVPIITSQQTGVATTGNTAQVLQTIQYRNTGVILKVKPVIHSGDQIDLDVVQEVSAAQTTETGVNASPTFSTRKLDTKLTLRNGSTVLLGGLISEEQSSGASGIPLLKDVPVLGGLFSKQSTGGKRRELIVLITPYVINNNQEAEEVTSAFRRMLRPWGGESASGGKPAEPSRANPQ